MRTIIPQFYLFIYVQILDDNIDEKTVHLTPKGFTETLRAVTSLPTNDSKELTQIALRSLIPSHHEAIGKLHQYHI